MKSFLLFLLFTPTLALSNPKVESRLGINEKGFNHFKSYFTEKFKERKDYYLEAYDGENYLLKTVQSPVKFRLKQSKEKYKVQFSKVLNRNSFSCGSTDISYTSRESKQLNISRSEFTKTKGTFNHTLLYIQQSDREIAKEYLRFQKAIRPLQKQGSNYLSGKLTNTVSIFLPTHRTKKFIWTTNMDANKKGQVEASLRVVIDYDSKQNPHTSYEVEFEPSHPNQWSAKELTQFVCHKFNIKALDASYFTDQRFSTPLETLELTRRINHLIGF